jgi:membrane-bound lytic murein transglycosylase A
MAPAWHARTFGRVAAVVLCGLLAADDGAVARRSHRHIHHAKADAPEFLNKPRPAGPIRFPDTRIEPLAWDELEGWAADDHAAAFAAYLASCRALVGSAKTARDARPVHHALVEICRHARTITARDDATARKFFEESFRPVRISKLDDPNGFLTGYYEPVVDGSRTPTDEFRVPLYRRPGDLVHMGRKHKADSFPNTGRVVRRIKRGKYVPYFDRAQIEDGALATRNLEIAYVRDWADAFFIQIQGSGRVKMQDGSVLRVNYDSHNGYPYTPVGRLLIERGIIPREEMSMDRIREWMTANPDGAKELRRQNKSFVFFRTVNLPEHEEARGAQGVPLTAQRSIAVDKVLHVYGTPFFIQADLPIATPASATKFRKLMIAQDTGSAIVGPARADIFFGAGAEAGRIAGRIKNPARFVMLMPRALDPVEAGKAMPLPVARPASAPAREPATDGKPDVKVDTKLETKPLPHEKPPVSPAPTPRVRPKS